MKYLRKNLSEPRRQSLCKERTQNLKNRKNLVEKNQQIERNFNRKLSFDVSPIAKKIEIKNLPHQVEDV